MRKSAIAILAGAASLTGCIMTPYGGASIFWKTQYHHDRSSSPVKVFRDGTELSGDYVRCDALKHPPPYECECSIWRAYPSDAIKVAYPPTTASSPRDHYSYMANTNYEPSSHDGHPDLQYGYTGRDRRIWFYRPSTKTLSSRVLEVEAVWDQQNSLRTWQSRARYVHIAGDAVYYIAGIEKFGKPDFSSKGPRELPESTVYDWNRRGNIEATPSPSGQPRFLVWKAALGPNGDVGPLLVAAKDGALPSARPDLYTFVPEDALPAYAPDHQGVSVQSCMANIRLGDLCSYRDHSLGGGNSHSEPVCEPFSEKRAAQIRAKMK